jgi:hypothetical protein
VEEQKSQSEKFQQAARALECDEDETRWDDRLKKVAAHKLKDAPKPE